MKNLLLLVSIAILLAFVYLSDPLAIFKSLSNANLLLILPAFLITPITLLLRSYRWDLLLRSINIKVNFKTLSKAFLASLFFSNITPGKAADPIRSYFLKRKQGIDISLTVSTVIVERFIDIFALLFFSLFILTKISNINTYYLLIFPVLFVIFLVSLKIERLRNWGINIALRILSVSKRLRDKVRDKERINKNFSTILKARKRYIVLASMLTIIIWLIDTLAFYLAFLALGANIPYIVLLSALSLSVLIGVISFLPGGIGSSEVSLAVLLSSYMPLSVATAGTLIGRFFTIWLAIFICAYFVRKV